MSENFQLKAGCVIQIGFKCKRLFVLAPQTGQPLKGQGTREQPNRDVNILKPPSCKMQTRLQAAGS